MRKNSYELTINQKINMFFRLLLNKHVPYKNNFLKYHLVRRKYILSKTSEFFNKNKFEPAPLLNRRFLDVGCGSSQISDELAFRGADILAIDKDLRILTVAKNNALHNGSPVDYQNRTFENLDETEKFDVVLLLDFIKKRDVKKVFDKTEKLLKEDGMLVISGSNKTIKSYIRNIIIPKFLLKMIYLSVKSKDLIGLKVIKNNLNKYGYNIIDTQGVDFSFFTGRWYKTKSTRVRYIMCATKKQINKESDKDI